MKIALKRFKHQGSVNGMKYIERANGTHGQAKVKKFSFLYCILHQTVNAKLSNLGNDQKNNQLLASLDPRWNSYLTDTHSDKITLDGQDYNIISVSLDDSDIVPVYQITIDSNNGF